MGGRLSTNATVRGRVEADVRTKQQISKRRKQREEAWQKKNVAWRRHERLGWTYSPMTPAELETDRTLGIIKIAAGNRAKETTHVTRVEIDTPACVMQPIIARDG